MKGLHFLYGLRSPSPLNSTKWYPSEVNKHVAGIKVGLAFLL